jgi:hypothetical protein
MQNQKENASRRWYHPTQTDTRSISTIWIDANGRRAHILTILNASPRNDITCQTRTLPQIWYYLPNANNTHKHASFIYLFIYLLALLMHAYTIRRARWFIDRTYMWTDTYVGD